MKPTAADIAIVIGKIEAGDWLDPSEKPISWSCVLYDLEDVPDGWRFELRPPWQRIPQCWQ